MATSPSRRPSSRPRSRALILDVEALEPRFLLSTVNEVFSDEKTIVSEIDPADKPTLDATGTQVDSYTLLAGDGYPEIRVELAWLPGQGAVDGSLRILDASGATLYRIPLDEVESLHANLDIPSNISCILEVDLAIREGDPGSYHLDLSWLRPPAPALLIQPSAVPAGFVVHGVPSTITPTSPMLHAGGFLPVVPGPTPGRAPSGVESFVPPTRTSLQPNPSTPGSSGPTPLADSSRSTFVGPLPIGPSTPDGGIFARRSNAVETLPIESTAGLEPSVVIQHASGSRVSPGSRHRLGFAFPLGPRSPGRSPIFQVQTQADDEPTSEGGAYLPVIAALVAAPPPVEAAPKIEARSTRRAVSKKTQGVASVLLVMTGSILMIFGLGAPERQATLSAWRGDRRTRRSA